MQNSLKRSKTTYDTSFMIAYAMGVRGVQYDNVPASTLSDWNNTESFDHIYGYNHMKGYQNMIVKAEQIRLLKSMIFSLVKLLTIFQTIVNTMPHKNRQLYQVREQIVSITEKWVKHYSLKQICRFLQVSQQQYISWKKSYYCKFSPVLLCRKAIPGQLTIKETEMIEKAVCAPEHKNWSLISIYLKMIRESERFFCEQTFYKYVSILGLRRAVRKKPRHSKTGPRAEKPLQLLHMDITEYWITDNIRLYIHVIMDNFSRKTLGIRVALKKSAKLACDNLKEVYEKYKLKNRENIMIMINDSGSENISVTKDYINSLPNMTQYFANGQKKNQWTNNMIEAHFKKIKKFIREHEYKNMNGFMTKLEETIELCNATIPIAATGGRTPNEAFEGINPFPENFSDQLEKARRRRIMVNETGECF